MSEFFKALEQAERDRGLKRPAEAAAPAVEVPDRPESVAETEAPPAPPEQWTPPPPAPPEQWSPPPSVFAAPAARPSVPATAPATDAGERDGLDGHLVSLVAPNSFGAEQYRTLRHMIEELHQSSHVSVVACTSPASGDGKTTSAINLAGALAQGPSARVLIVDADLRRPCVARELTLGEDAGPGLVGAILNRGLTLADVVRQRPPFSLSILPAGSTVSNPYELLKSPRFAELMDEARRDYDYVVLDTPPAVAIPDCRAIAPVVDGFVLVVSAHRTPRRMVEEALNAMEPRRLLGVLFNQDDRALGGYYYFGSYRGPGTNGSAATRWKQGAKKASNSIGRGLGRLKRGRR